MSFSVTICHLDEDYSGPDYMFVRLVVWFTRVPVRVTAAPAARTRLAQWLAIKTGFA